MPLISSFLGILVYMYQEENKPHFKPHVHARYRGQELSIAHDGEVLAGGLPRKQQKAVEAWVAYREDEILASWAALNEDGIVVEIKGLEA
ncbi:MAG: DUF4160 domain-containing protein [Coriobacteriales bacterium]|nr:DUF4160 domain-containing protein [Coriobacteriales bacterium]